MTIVAISDGDFAAHETLAIDRYVVELCRQLRAADPHRAGRPLRALIVPTASGDSPTYYEAFRDVYGDRLGCETDVLYLIDDAGASRAEELVEWADLIYVGGGQTARLIDVWNDRGFRELLRRTASDRTVYTGMSAGALCWFSHGFANVAEGGSSRVFELVTGVGLVDAVYSPHIDQERRLVEFVRCIRATGLPGYAGLTNTALVWRDGEVSVVTGGEDTYVLEARCLGNAVILRELHPCRPRLPADR